MLAINFINRKESFRNEKEEMYCMSPLEMLARVPARAAW